MNKRGQSDITLEEARLALEPYGAIAHLGYLNSQVQETLGLPVSVTVEYEMFDPSRDLQAVCVTPPSSPVPKPLVSVDASLSRC